MNQVDGFSAEDGVPPLLLATLHMDEAVDVFRRHTFRPFPGPSEEDPDWNAWHSAEEGCRERCEMAIREWMTSRHFPILDDDEAYFLRRRFDFVSLILQKLFLEDQTSIFSHVGVSLEEVLWWALVDWWEAHGVGEAFWEDLSHEEQT